MGWLPGWLGGGSNSTDSSKIEAEAEKKRLNEENTQALLKFLESKHNVNNPELSSSENLQSQSVEANNKSEKSTPNAASLSPSTTRLSENELATIKLELDRRFQQRLRDLRLNEDSATGMSKPGPVDELAKLETVQRPLWQSAIFSITYFGLGSTMLYHGLFNIRYTRAATLRSGGAILVGTAFLGVSLFPLFEMYHMAERIKEENQARAVFEHSQNWQPQQQM